jgi:hypothetical protein
LPTQALLAAADRAALEEHAVARDRRHRARAATSWGKLMYSNLSPNGRDRPMSQDYRPASSCH